MVRDKEASKIVLSNFMNIETVETSHLRSVEKPIAFKPINKFPWRNRHFPSTSFSFKV